MTPPPSARGLITDVDGVVLATPHAAAWREAVERYAARLPAVPTASLDAAIYQRFVAGVPREEGARAALRAVGLPAAPDAVAALCAIKQTVFGELVEHGEVRPYDDAIALLRAWAAAGLPVAAASASRNAAGLLGRCRAADEPVDALYSVPPSTGPKPEVFVEAARRLGLAPAQCVVVEDSAAAIAAARARGFACVGVDRSGTGAALLAAGAELVVSTLDDVPRPAPLERVAST